MADLPEMRLNGVPLADGFGIEVERTFFDARGYLSIKSSSGELYGHYTMQRLRPLQFGDRVTIGSHVVHVEGPPLRAH